MYITPADYSARLPPFTFMQINILYLGRAHIGNVVWSAAEDIMKCFSRNFELYFSLHLTKECHFVAQVIK
jgi:hypothetical protein